MTDEELISEVRDLRERVSDLQDEFDRLKALPAAVAELQGMVKTLTGLVTTRFDGVQKGVEKAAGIRTALTFASVVIVPILVALIGGYFVLKAGVR